MGEESSISHGIFSHLASYDSCLLSKIIIGFDINQEEMLTGWCASGVPAGWGNKQLINIINFHIFPPQLVNDKANCPEQLDQFRITWDRPAFYNS